MKHDTQRDASIDTFLRKSLRRDPAPAPDGSCVEPEAIAAWTEGTLSRKEAAAIEAHVANCAACQQVLAVFARTVPVPVESGVGRTRWHLRWAIPATAAATAVAIWVAVPDDRKEPVQDAFAVADSTPSTESSEPAAKSEVDAAAPPVVAPERSESAARRDADSSLRARVENREVRQEKQEASPEAFAREPAAPAAAAAPPSDTRPLADAAEAPAAARSAAVAQQRQAEAFAPLEVVSPDPNVRWRVLTTGRLERSINAGQTWETVALQQKVTAVRALSATTAIATAVDGRQFRTDNQGRTWDPVQP